MSARLILRTAHSLTPRSAVYIGVCRGKATAASSQPVEDGQVKPFKDIPTPKGLPIIGTLLEIARRSGELNELVKERHETYGPIYREMLGNISTVFLRDVTAVEELLRQDAKYPQRVQIEYWKEYRKRRGYSTGLVMSDGERWQELRRVVDKQMMKPKTVESYTGEFNKVVAEFLERMVKIRTPDKEVPALNTELFNWSLESIARILFEKRMGCISDDRSQDTADFIQSSHDIFEQTRKIIILPPKLAKLLIPGTCKKHDEAWDAGFRVSHKVIDERIREIREQSDGDQHVGILTHFLKEDAMHIKDVYANISELMGAAVDTTSNTTQMALYELSRHPEVQNALYEEVTRIVPDNEQPSADHLKQMHYVRAIVKETLRLYPTGSIVARVLQKDITLLGYNVPKGTTVWVDLYGMGRFEKEFTDADSFLPERWLRESRTEKANPFAWLPFGFGPRMCVGRRVAELEMYLLLTQLVRKFKIEAVSKEPVAMTTNLLLLAKDPVRIRLLDRQ